MGSKLLVGCSCGAEDALRVTAAYLAATADAQREVALWLVGDGVRLAIDGYADQIRAGPGAPAVRDLHARFVEAGGRMFVCGVSLDALGLGGERLGRAAGVATAGDVFAWAGPDAQSVSF